MGKKKNIFFAPKSVYLDLYVTGSRYILKHFYCLAVEVGFYSDVVESLPVDPATWVRFQAEAGEIFSPYDIYIAITKLGDFCT